MKGYLRAYHHAFTLVELMIVVAVIVILSAISISAYIQQQETARADRAEAMAQTVIGGAENYYAQNGEYPLASSLSNLNTAATTLGTTKENLTQSGITFTPCENTGSGCSFSGSNVYYVSRASQGDATNRSYTVGSCSIVLSGSSSSSSGASSFFVTYFNASSAKWVFKKSIKGTATISGASCQFS